MYESMNDVYEQVRRIISPVYMVGGSVRDALMGVEPKDYDFITPHEPDTVEQSIRSAGRKPFLTGKRFGTVGVKIGGHLVEITTFRTERYREGSRKPDVEFVTDIAADLSRRDFTINAMAIKNGEVIDPFNGRRDIEQKIVRCVGDASARFIEDPLRMLRAARFSAQIGFTVDQAIYDAVRQLGYRIMQVSRERWVGELDRLLLSPYVDKGLKELMETELLRYIIPELSLQKWYSGGDIWEETLGMVLSVPADITLRWAALLCNMARPFYPDDDDTKWPARPDDNLGSELVIRLGTYLRWSNKRITAVSLLVKERGEQGSPLNRSVKKSSRGTG
ncbi:MAG TPA: CCA tRNA nucleotidyltransferase [Deltaproteobacteria bacterium]|nr:CCA tRNA nucleotidyltransferase [Deltaproteobacteria bacterium]